MGTKVLGCVLPPAGFLGPIPARVCVSACVCVGGGSPHQQVILGPQQRLRIHLNSDTIYLDIESDSIRERLGLTRPPATTDASVETQVVTCAPDSLVLS